MGDCYTFRRSKRRNEKTDSKKMRGYETIKSLSNPDKAPSQSSNDSSSRWTSSASEEAPSRQSSKCDLLYYGSSLSHGFSSQQPSEIFFESATVVKPERKDSSRDFHRPELAPIQFLPIETYIRAKQQPNRSVSSRARCSFSSTENSHQSKLEALCKPDNSVCPNIGRKLYEEFYIGVHRQKSVRKFLKANEFRLYYKLPKSRNDISVRLPLFIAYMSSSGKIHHFPVICEKQPTSQQAWYVVTNVDKVITFPSLLSLIRFYKIYAYMHPKTGKIDTFLVDEDSDGERTN